MSTNHNRIKVADLETNQPNKILKTNLNGELEFSDANNLQTENYNALDCTSEGKTLDARQGKVLKDMINNKTVNLASDAETQINTSISEDNKIVSRSKLFNWWQWVKSQTQTISGAWNFSNKVTLRSGTKDIPPLIIPNGTLTSPYQNGAIERDENGQLWETNLGIRSRILTTADQIVLVPYKTPGLIQTNISGPISATNQSTSLNTKIGSIKNSSVLRLNLINEVYFSTTSPSLGNIEPTDAKTEIYLKINNGLFSSNYTGISTTNQVKIIEFSGLKNNGLKNYQSAFITQIQNSNLALAQWSTLSFFTQNIKDGVTTNGEATYYLRDELNTRTFGASEASFSFVFVNTVTYDDSTNIKGQNKSKLIRLNSLAIYLETIR
ncbi:hypothetical protein [Flavobacterium johnsoniae]|uniref:Uncharacterized protein n=1 Tax=Flavobacterium johnsoniae TaxID=986 RepID=A0A1J7BU41_FLAJO|nr:hypothetical protein [Flavobacterium johnsoniae]OIV42230.1 hypothetical protein BKM63_11420 [Flavobacterium johnsoniae]